MIVVGVYENGVTNGVRLQQTSRSRGLLSSAGSHKSNVAVSKLLTLKNVRITFVTTEACHKSIIKAQDVVLRALKKREEVQFETISDGLTSDSERSDVEVVLNMLFEIGGETLRNLDREGQL